jgi:hypothetical protein
MAEAGTKTAESPSITVEIVGPTDVAWFDQQLEERHYLQAGRSVGDYLRQVVRVRGRPVALLAWGPACYALKDRDRWLGWSATQRVERLKLVVQNRRFLLLTAKGEAPNLASQTLAAAVRVLPEHWQQAFGYRPLLAESFTDPEAYAGTCYKASNWQPVGQSAGYSRHRADFYADNEHPKRLWLRELDPQARRHLRSAVPARRLPAGRHRAPVRGPAGQSVATRVAVRGAAAGARSPGEEHPVPHWRRADPGGPGFARGSARHLRTGAFCPDAAPQPASPDRSAPQSGHQGLLRGAHLLGVLLGAHAPR